MTTLSPISGFSKEARQVARATRKQRRSLRETTEFGDRASFDELASVWENCKHPNWDGYAALPVTQDTFCNAYRFLESLPLGIARPSIGAEPDGDLEFEWHHSPRRTLSVSVSEDGLLHYAGLFGPNRANGTVAFFGDLPQEISELIDRVCGV